MNNRVENCTCLVFLIEIAMKGHFGHFILSIEDLLGLVYLFIDNMNLIIIVLVDRAYSRDATLSFCL